MSSGALEHRDLQDWLSYRLVWSPGFQHGKISPIIIEVVLLLLGSGLSWAKADPAALNCCVHSLGKGWKRCSVRRGNGTHTHSLWSEKDGHKSCGNAKCAGCCVCRYFCWASIEGQGGH